MQEAILAPSDAGTVYSAQENAGERCVLSEMMSTCDMTRREKQRFKSDRSLKKHCSFYKNMRFTLAGGKTWPEIVIFK